MKDSCRPFLKKSTNMHENSTHISSEPQVAYQTYYKNLEQLDMMQFEISFRRANVS